MTSLATSAPAIDDARASDRAPQLWLTTHRGWVGAGVAVLAGVYALMSAVRRRQKEDSLAVA